MAMYGSTSLGGGATPTFIFTWCANEVQVDMPPSEKRCRWPWPHLPSRKGKEDGCTHLFSFIGREKEDMTFAPWEEKEVRPK